jgi:hypothetical protein
VCEMVTGLSMFWPPFDCDELKTMVASSRRRTIAIYGADSVAGWF